MNKISFIFSGDREYNISRALSLIKSDVISDIKKARNIVVKPNCVVGDCQLASTHYQAIRALLDFIAPFAQRQITLAEGTAIGDTFEAFKNYGYFDLQEQYDFTVLDLNKDDYENIELVDKKGNPLIARISKTILLSDYLISISPPKTHDCVVYTGAIKNVAVGSLPRLNDSLANRIASRFGISKNNKELIHQDNWGINENIKRIASKINIKLAILDGFASMQGNGPSHDGEMVASHWAIASSSPLMADILATKLMSINLSDVGYLSMLNEIIKPDDDPFVIGDNWKKHVTDFKMHDNFDLIRDWSKKQ